MKGLIYIPNEKDLIAAYSELQQFKKKEDVNQIVLWSQWSRFDPRLAEQVVHHVSQTWKSVSPIELHQALITQPWPASFGVILKQIEFFGNLSKSVKQLFISWSRCVMSGISPASGELYFIGLRSFGGKLMRKDALMSLKSYRQWGYLGQEALVQKPALLNIKRKTLISVRSRLAFLDEFIKTHPSITVRDYIEALGGWISRKQACRDLNANPHLKRKGQTRGRVYYAI